MKSPRFKHSYLVLVLQLCFACLLLASCSSVGFDITQGTAHSNSTVGSGALEPLTVAISPYQDIAQIVNSKSLGLEKKYSVKLDFVTMAWDDILPAIASNGHTVDVGFGSLIEYLSKWHHINDENDDPVVFVYPAYVFRGGAFISFNPAVPILTPENINDPVIVKKFLSFRIGIQKHNLSEMVLYSLARRVGLKPSQLHTVDNTINDCLLACEQGSLDASFAGLTQRTEAFKRKGHVVLAMDTAGIVDITGFVCKRSVLKKRATDLESLIAIWFDCSTYVTSDIDHHSAATLAYLKANASTQYTLAEFRKALSQEYFPRTYGESQNQIVSPTGKYSINRISDEIGQYLVATGQVKVAPPAPQIKYIWAK